MRGEAPLRPRAEGDLVAEGGELADEVARAALVEVGVEVDVAGVGVGEEVPHDDEDRALDGDECLLLPLSSREAAVALPPRRCRS